MLSLGGTDGRYNASEIVERQIALGRGDARAIVAEDATLTYEELRRQVNRAGRLLNHLGVVREQRVLLVLDDTTVFPIVFLGAIRIGAVPVPVSPFEKDENLRHFVADSHARVIVTDAHLHERLVRVLRDCEITYLVRGGEGPGVIEFDDGLARESEELDAVTTHRDDMAFWLYSSGTTGKPKGVVHLQHDIEVTCQGFAGGVLGLTAGDVTFSTTKLFHAYGLGNGLSFPLWSGATAVLMTGRPKADRVLATLREHRPTIFFSVPALFAALVLEPQADGALDSVRFCVSASEVLPPMTIARWRDRFGLEIVDGIGSTEMLNTYCSNRPGRIEPGTTGWPVPGYALRLVDETGKVLEGPAVGGLQVCGDSCAAFYWHQHEKTKRSMLGDWFVTGDRYERREDGAYRYVGRDDDMLKVGGLWVSPVDVERVLAEHPSVADVGVVGTRVADATRLVAYITTTDDTGQRALVDELRDWCDGRLASHEYPHFVKVVEELPRTANGKVQRHWLRDWAAEFAEDSLAPVSALVRTWSDVLRTPVSESDDFFALGGDSLAASELIFAIEEEFGVKLTTADLFTASKLSDLARLLIDHRAWQDGKPVRLAAGELEGRRLFLVPGMGYSILGLRAFAGALADEIVVYGLPAWEPAPVHTTVHDEARRLAEGLRSVQSAGPYWIGGHSSGGMVALEIARLLEEQGEEVAGLLIFDTQLVPGHRSLALHQRVVAYARDLRSPGSVIQRIYATVHFPKWVHARILKFDPGLEGSVGVNERYLERLRMEARAIRRYVPGPCRAPVTLVRCPDISDPTIESVWRNLGLGGVTVRQVNAPHAELLEPPYVAIAADEAKRACPWPSVSSAQPVTASSG